MERSQPETAAVIDWVLRWSTEQWSGVVRDHDVYPVFSLVELLHCYALIGRELHALKGPTIGALSDATPALLCHKEPARASKAPY